MSFDFSFFQFLHGLAGRSKALGWLFIFLAKFLPYILVIIFVVIIWRLSKNWRRQLYYAGFTIISLLFSWVILLSLRIFFPRPRPFIQLNFDALINHSASPSLPSAHATIFFTLAIVLIFVFRKRKIGWLYSGNADTLAENNRRGTKASNWFLIAVIFMALSRIVVGVHWPLDILAGLLIALLSVVVANRLLPLSK